MRIEDMKVGAFVKNFGYTCRVKGFHEATGDPILFGPYDADVPPENRQTWLASAEKCEAAETANLAHREGFVAF